MNNNELMQLEDMIRNFFTKNNIRDNLTIDIEYSLGSLKIDFVDLGEFDDVSELKDRIEELEYQADEWRDENHDLQYQNKKLENEIKELKDKLELKECEIEVIEKQNDKLENRIHDLCDEIYKLECKITERLWG